VDESRSLISVETGENELLEIQHTKYKEAITNLVTGKTPKDVVFQRPAGRGVNVDYVPGWWFVQQLNALFGYFWDFEIIDQAIGENQCWVRGKLTIKDPKTGLTVTKTAFGGSKLKSKENQAIDIGDDLKTAATDSLKKAATLLGIASDIYGKREKIDETAATKTQLSSMYKLAEKKGMNKSQIDEYCEKQYKDAPENLETIKVLEVIQWLRSRPDKNKEEK